MQLRIAAKVLLYRANLRPPLSKESTQIFDGNKQLLVGEAFYLRKQGHSLDSAKMSWTTQCTAIIGTDCSGSAERTRRIACWLLGRGQSQAPSVHSERKGNMIIVLSKSENWTRCTARIIWNHKGNRGTVYLDNKSQTTALFHREATSLRLVFQFSYLPNGHSADDIKEDEGRVGVIFAN